MKQIVVASGKGGTGKTTLTALFAHRAATWGLRVAVADADVEASNLPIALHGRDAVCEEFAGGAVAVVDPDGCTSCGLCEDVCRFEAVSARSGRRAPYEIDPWFCEGCGYCSHVCAADAVTMVPATAGVACLGVCDTGPMAHGQLRPGEDLSGRLVTEVRRRAAIAAQEHDADILLIDGPPGIGCPVIAAVTGTDLLVAVTEPTVSGEHDLSRLVDLAARFSIPVRTVLNKADLSEEGAERIRQRCARAETAMVGEIPFDDQLASALDAMAGGGVPDPRHDSAGVSAALSAWETVVAELFGAMATT